MTTEVTHIWIEFHKELKGFIFKKVQHQADADDILQEVFIKIICSIERVRQAENLRKYLYGIVKNAINDYFRRTKFMNNMTDLSEILLVTETEFLDVTSAHFCLKPFIDKLPEKYKEALILTEFQDFSQKDLAKKLDISYSAAKSRVQRAREKLKELFLKCYAYQIEAYRHLLRAEIKSCNCLATL
jgi:RNA polymerase sigma-70 factor, ECF subfamily